MVHLNVLVKGWPMLYSNRDAAKRATVELPVNLLHMNCELCGITKLLTKFAKNDYNPSFLSLLKLPIC